MAERVTTETLAAILERVEQANKDGFDRIEHKLEGFVLKEVHTSEMVDVNRRVGRLESANGWIVRSSIGAVAALVLSGIGLSLGLHP